MVHLRKQRLDYLGGVIIGKDLFCPDIIEPFHRHDKCLHDDAVCDPTAECGMALVKDHAADDVSHDKQRDVYKRQSLQFLFISLLIDEALLPINLPISRTPFPSDKNCCRQFHSDSVKWV